VQREAQGDGPPALREKDGIIEKFNRYYDSSIIKTNSPPKWRAVQKIKQLSF